MTEGSVIITGATGSMGAVATKAMAAEGRHVVMACRNLEKGESVRNSILKEIPDAKLELAALDLCSKQSVKNFAAKMEGRRIAALFNNAGVLSRDYVVNAEGIERTMAVNYLNTALLTLLLAQKMEAGANIVNMVSVTTKIARLHKDWRNDGKQQYGQLKTYGRSKLALLLFSVALADHFPSLHVNVADPGVVNSNMITMERWFDPIADLIFRPLISSPEKGAAPAIAALHCEDSGLYFVGRNSNPIPSRFKSNPLVDTLWEECWEYLGYL